MQATAEELRAVSIAGIVTIIAGLITFLQGVFSVRAANNTEKIMPAVSTPVLLTGGVQTKAQAEELLRQGKADLIGVGRAIFKDAHGGEKA